LRIERNGELVWAGPIVSIERPVRNGSGADFVTISASDIMKWMSRRTIKEDLAFNQSDAGLVFKDVLDSATSLDNLFGLECPIFQTGYAMTRQIVALNFEYASDILEELARSAVDYFVLGTDLVVQNQDATGFPAGWYVIRDGVQEQLAPTPDPFGRYFFGLFTDEAWVERPGWVIDGEAQANNVYVPGADSGEGGFRRFWTASDVDMEAGLLDYVDVSTLYRPQAGTPITSIGVFQERADSLLALRRDAPVILSGGMLGQNAPVTVDMLFPGSLWSIDLADHGVSQLLSIQRLKRVDVQVSVGEGGISERVSPTFIPIGTDEAGGN
uniref:hypothetical protein n=1 Tax=Gemmatimonas sp. TaxID=1962908 RepID=UPI003565ED78